VDRPQIIVVGGGIAGLTAALLLARRQHAVTLVERDPPDVPQRPGVPQYRLPHAFIGRVRTILRHNAPDVLDRMDAAGVAQVNLFRQVIPPGQWEPGDDDFTGLWSRRSTFEYALRQAVNHEPGITLRCPARVVDVVLAGSAMAGVRLADGTTLCADLVLDCTGSRSPLSRRLQAHGVELPTDSQDCETVYFSRHYRFTPDCRLPRAAVAMLRGMFADGTFNGFPGDDGTYAFALECHPSNPIGSRLRTVDGWEAVARSIPAVAPWIDPGSGVPIEDVQVMGGLRNVRRRLVVAGRPVVLGLLPVGDSLCATNPAYGWGAAMALTYAVAAADAVAEHGSDLDGVARAYDAATAADADAAYRESAAMDRARIYHVTGRPVPEDDRASVQRQQAILAALGDGRVRDVEVMRAFGRRANLAGSIPEALGAQELVDRGRAAVHG
jgi:2-polyprenyl-6-methoxyphenol hydroxylase-like FAD-dependent oxidoreductase